MRHRAAHGFTYVGVLLLIGIVSAVLAATGTVWSHSAQREKERELIHVGDQFRRAIGLYYERTPGPIKRFPSNLEELLLDSRHLTMQRYLRRVYADPITGKAEWGFVAAPDGGIMGVHSLSQAEPIKSGNFPKANETFADATRYADWKFTYVPVTSLPQAIKPPLAK